MDTDLLYRVTREDEAKLIALLTECFTNDPLYQELIPDEEKREKLLPELFRCDLDEMFEDCEIYANNENLEAIVAVSYTHLSSFSLPEEIPSYTSIVFGRIRLTYLALQKATAAAALARCSSQTSMVSIS